MPRKTSTKNVKKRSGRIVPFNQKKITDAIWKAMKAVGQGSYFDAKDISDKVVKGLDKKYKESDGIPSVEEIQDLVERELVLAKLPDTAKAYILYRDLHSRMRNINNLLDIGDKVESYVNKEDWKVHADCEIDYTLQGLYKNLVNEIAERYWMNEIYDEEIRELHYNKDFHIHKSSTLSAYCVGWDLEDLLVTGLQGVAGNVSCSPAKHFSTALGHVMKFLYIMSNETPDGAVAVSNFDTFLAPFIRYDKLSYEEVKQNIQGFIYLMNSPQKYGGQIVFSNITLDLQCPKILAKQPVIIGGKLKKAVYGDFQKEMNMFNKALLEVYAEGDAKGRVFTWPIPTYNIDKDFDWDNKNFEGLWEMTAKYGVPYFANFVNSDMSPDDVRSMCCRLRIDNRQLQKRGGGLFGANPLTGSIGYVTINLPRIAYQNKGKKREFYKRLGYLMDVAHRCLQSRRELIERFANKGLYPYTSFYLRNVKEKTGKYWSNHFNTIGLIGMNETSLNFFGNGTDISTKKGQKFAKDVLEFMNKRILKYQEETGVMYNLEASPAEATAYSLARKDKELFPDIIVANEASYKKGAEPYYTNSTQLPVGFTQDLFEAMDLQDDLQTMYTGGTVFHAFLGERLNHGETVKKLVKVVTKKYKMPYFTLTPTFSICESHGYLNGEHFVCPTCGEDCMVYSRVVGKISPIQRWNPGKKSEFKERKTFKVHNGE